MTDKEYNHDASPVMDEKGNFLMTFPIGDWSRDGHGRCAEYIVSSKKPTQDVREAHFKLREKVGFSVEDICKDYEDGSFGKSIANKLRALGYQSFPDSDVEDEVIYPASKELINIWTFLLNHVDPSLRLSVVDMPSINFDGRDKKQRQIDFVGYEIFGN